MALGDNIQKSRKSKGWSQRELAEGLAERVRPIDSLGEEDRHALVHMIDSTPTKKRMRELLGGSLAPTGTEGAARAGG